MILIYLNHPMISGVEDLMVTIDPILNRAYEVFAKLDCDLIREILGVNAGDSFLQHRLALNPLSFAGSAEEALKRATYKRENTNPGRAQHPKSRRVESEVRVIKCRQCHETLPKGGNFSAHNKICKMRKTK